MSAALPAAIAAQMAQTQLNVALSSLKANAQADQQIANILEQAVQTVPASSSRGTNVNFRA